MTDLDFDELDRAVSSLINRDGAVPPTSQTAEPPADEPAPALPPPAPPVREHPVSQVVIPKRAAPLGAKRPLAPAAARGARGGIIDIVASKPANRPLVRTSAQLTPLSDEGTLRAAAATPPASLPPQQPAPSPPLQPSVPQQPTPSPAASPWPDPLEFEESAPAAPPPSPEPTPQQETTPPPLEAGQSDAVAVTPESPTNEEAPSPFVSTPKVEKRPLGAYSTYAPAEEKGSLEVSPAQQPTASAPPELEEESIPPELSPAVLAAESNEEAVKKKPVPEHKDKKGAPAPTPEAAGKSLHQAAMLSIPKQYQTTNKPLDTLTHPIYDSKEYHPPLLEPQAVAKKGKRAVTTKLIITLVIIAVLAIAGFVAYQFFAKTQPPVS